MRGGGSVRRTGKAEGSSGGAFSKQVGGADAPAQAHGVNAAAPLNAVSSLLGLQEVDDATARASRGKMRAQEMLDKLDEIRHGLLAGALPRQKLMDLARTVQTRRMQVDDPKLAEILDEIDLRAQVELAKLTP